MTFTFIITFIITFLLTFFSIQFFITHGKIKFKKEFLRIFIVIAIVLVITFFLEKSPEYNSDINTYFFIGVIIFAVFSFFLNVKRGYSFVFSFLSAASIICLMISFNFEGILFGIFYSFGMGISVFSLYLVWKYPFHNCKWLEGLAYEVSEKIQTKGKYSSKPIIIKINSSKTFLTGNRNLKIWFKKDHVVLKISKKFHKNLNYPNLEDFSELFLREIINYKNFSKTEV